MIIHGHRGSRGTHPENIIPSFAEAHASGAHWVELDVHLTRDGHLIVHHDLEISGKLCRGVDGSPLARAIPIADLQLEDIRTYEIGTLKLAAYPEQQATPGERIPTLEDLILWKKREAPSLRLNVEIKSGSAAPDRLAEATIDLLKKHNILRESLVQSFDFDIVRSARKRDATVRLSCLFERPADFAKEAQACRAQVVAAHYLLIDANVARDCLAAGLELLPWTVNEAQHWDRLHALGVTSMITDYPRKLAAHLKRK